MIDRYKKTIVLYSDKKYEDQALNTIRSFNRVDEDFQFLYFQMNFSSQYDNPKVIPIIIMSEELPNVQLLKPTILSRSTELVNDFIYVDVDLIASKHFNYDKLVSRIIDVPYGSVLHETHWQKPVYFWYIGSVRHELDESEMMKYLGVPQRTQKWVTTLMLAVNQKCKPFINEWESLCLNKSLWNDDEGKLANSPMVNDPYRLYFHIGDETPYNVLLWRNGLSGYYLPNIILEPKEVNTFLRVENERVINERLEEDNPMTDCSDSNNIFVYHQLKDVNFREKVLYELDKYKGKKIEISYTNKTFIEPNLNVDGSYSLNVLKKMGFNPKNILDIGACFVEWSSRVVNIFPDANFHLIEAMDYEQLHNLPPNMKYTNALLSDTIEDVEWFEASPGGNSMFREVTKHFESCDIYTKTTNTLDNIFTHNETFDLIKIDTQGSELPILRGGQNLLRRGVKVIMMEIPFMGEYNKGVGSFTDHILYMDSIGFRVCDITEIHRMEEVLVQIDILFINKNETELISKFQDRINNLGS